MLAVVHINATAQQQRQNNNTKQQTKPSTPTLNSGMLRDSSWNGAAQQYEQLFEWALMDAPYAQV